MAITPGNIKVEPSDVFFDGVNLGCIDGDVEVTTEEQLVDVTCHQSGTQVIDSIRTGVNVSIAVALKETSTSQLQTALGYAGDTVTAEAEVTTVTTVADVSGSLDGTYFTLNSAGDATNYYVWIDVAAGGNDPAPAGLTGIQVSVATNDTADDVATAVASAVTGNADFGASASGSVVTITHAATGGATNAADVDSGFTIAITNEGIGAVTGWGESKRFTNVSNDTKILKLHPANTAESDVSRDLVFWKAYPVLESITKSGENPQTVSLTFRIFPDSSRPSGANIFALGALAG